MSYFVKRLGQAPIDIEQVLNYALDKAKTRGEQENVYNALVFKMQMLWAMLDALHYSYCEPGLIPPGAFKPED
jgi:pyrroloquinoline-quinone synthase